MIERYERYKLFQDFHDQAKTIYEGFEKGDAQHQQFLESHTFYVAPGGGFGGVDARLVEVYFGARPVDTVTENPTNFFQRPQKRHVPEQGARLRYQRLIDGRVGCFLIPGSTPEWRPFETMIVLKLGLHPRRLNDSDTLLKSQWNALHSYMACTSLEGSPTWSDRIRIGYYRWFKCCVIDDKLQPPRIYTEVYRIVRFSLTVGLSGFLLLLIQHFFPSTPAK